MTRYYLSTYVLLYLAPRLPPLAVHRVLEVVLVRSLDLDDGGLQEGVELQPRQHLGRGRQQLRGEGVVVELLHLGLEGGLGGAGLRRQRMLPVVTLLASSSLHRLRLGRRLAAKGKHMCKFWQLLKGEGVLVLLWFSVPGLRVAQLGRGGGGGRAAAGGRAARVTLHHTSYTVKHRLHVSYSCQRNKTSRNGRFGYLPIDYDLCRKASLSVLIDS